MKPLDFCPVSNSRTVELIREFPAQSPDWRNWLQGFPEPPDFDSYRFERFMNRIGPYLNDAPSLALLDRFERLSLALLFTDYADELLIGQRRDNAKTAVEGFVLAISGWGAWLDVALLTPVSLLLSGFLFSKSMVDKFKWSGRRRELLAVADWIRTMLRYR